MAASAPVGSPPPNLSRELSSDASQWYEGARGNQNMREMVRKGFLTADILSKKKKVLSTTSGSGRLPAAAAMTSTAIQSDDEFVTNKQFVWQFNESLSWWTNFPAKAQQPLDDGFLRHYKHMTVDEDQGLPSTFRVDFVRRKQLSVSSGLFQKVRRHKRGPLPETVEAEYQWENEDGNWIAFPLEGKRRIERAYAESTSSVILTAEESGRTSAVIVMLHVKRVMEIHSKKQRRFRAIGQARDEAERSFLWEHSRRTVDGQGNDGWIAFPRDTARQIEASFQRRSGGLQLSRGGIYASRSGQYYLDLSNLELKHVPHSLRWKVRRREGTRAELFPELVESTPEAKFPKYLAQREFFSALTTATANDLAIAYDPANPDHVWFARAWRFYLALSTQSRFVRYIMYASRRLHFWHDAVFPPELESNTSEVDVIRTALAEDPSLLTLGLEEGGRTCLHVCASITTSSPTSGAILGLLLGYPRANVNQPAGVHALTPLMAAAQRGSVEMADVLLEHKGTDVFLEDDQGATALHLACARTDAAAGQLVARLLQAALAQEKLSAPNDESSAPAPGKKVISPSEEDPDLPEPADAPASESTPAGIPVAPQHVPPESAADVISTPSAAFHARSPRDGLASPRDATTRTRGRGPPGQRNSSKVSGRTAGAFAELRRLTDGATPLSVAVQQGNLDGIRELLKLKDFNPDVPDLEKRTPLHQAAILGFTEAADLLGHDPRVHVNVDDGKDCQPLIYAVKNGHAECVEVMASNDRYNMRYHDGEFFTPLMHAARMNNVKMVETMIRYRGRLYIDQKFFTQPYSSLQLACIHGNYESFELLRRAQATYNQTDKRLRTTLHLAAVGGNPEIIRRLALKKLDINARDGKKRTPLHLAALNKQAGALQALLELGADYTLRDNQGLTPKQFSADPGIIATFEKHVAMRVQKISRQLVAMGYDREKVHDVLSAAKEETLLDFAAAQTSLGPPPDVTKVVLEVAETGLQMKFNAFSLLTTALPDTDGDETFVRICRAVRVDQEEFMDHQVAIKLHFDKEGFEMEREALQRLAGPGVVQVRAYSSASLRLRSMDGKPWKSDKYPVLYALVMECGDEDLEEYIVNNWASLGYIHRLRILTDCAVALQRIHSRGWAHNDVKPKNLMRFGDSWKWIDMDTARQLEDPVPGLTPRTAAPEVIAAHESGETLYSSDEADMFSLGMTAFFLFSERGRYYFKSGEEATRVLAKESWAISEKRLENNVPGQVRPIIRALVHRDPDDRMTWKRLMEKLVQGKTIANVSTTEIKKIAERLDQIDEKQVQIIDNQARAEAKLDQLRVEGARLALAVLANETFPSLFIVLPANPKSGSGWWKRSSPFTTPFQVHILCAGDTSEAGAASPAGTFHVTDHPGYRVKLSRDWVRRAAPALRFTFWLLSTALRVVTYNALDLPPALLALHGVDGLEAPSPSGQQEAKADAKAVGEELDSVSSHLITASGAGDEDEDGVLQHSVEEAIETMDEKAMRSLVRESHEMLRELLSDTPVQDMGGLSMGVVDGHVRWLCPEHAAMPNVVLKKPAQLEQPAAAGAAAAVRADEHADADALVQTRAELAKLREENVQLRKELEKMQRDAGNDGACCNVM